MKKIFKISITFISIAYYYLLFILGCILTSWILYSRFIQERLPKDIPFFLTEIRFWIIIYICCIYLFIVKQLIFSKKNQSYQKIFSILLNILYTPLSTVDHLIKYNIYFKNYYVNFMYKFIRFLAKQTAKQMTLLIVLFQIIPRCILISVFAIDIFYFNEIKIFYKCILLGLLPVIHRYIKYSIDDLQNYYIDKLILRYEKVLMLDKAYANPHIEWELSEHNNFHDQWIPIKDFIEFKIKQATFTIASNVDYDYSPSLKDDIYEEYRKKITGTKDINVLIPAKELVIIEQDFHHYLKKILYIAVFLQNYSNISQHKNINIAKIVIFSVYLICWVFILVISYFHFPIEFKLFKIFLCYLFFYSIKYNDQFLNIYEQTITNYLTEEVLLSLWEQAQKSWHIQNDFLNTVISMIMLVFIIKNIKIVFIEEQINKQEKKNKITELATIYETNEENKEPVHFSEKKEEKLIEISNPPKIFNEIIELPEEQLKIISFEYLMKNLVNNDCLEFYGKDSFELFGHEYKVENTYYKQCMADKEKINEYLDKTPWKQLCEKYEYHLSNIVKHVMENYIQISIEAQEIYYKKVVTRDTIIVCKQKALNILWDIIKETDMPQNMKQYFNSMGYINELFNSIPWLIYMRSTDYAAGEYCILKQIFKKHLELHLSTYEK